MSTSVARLGQAFRLDHRLAWLVALLGVCGVMALVGLATRLGTLHIAAALAAIGLVTVLGLRWPILPLAIFAALIPIEEVILIEGLGTVSRFAGILFAVTYGVPRLGRLSYRAMPIAAWAFIAWALLSLGWAIEPTVTWTHLPTLLQLFVIALLIADFVVQQPAIVRPLLWIYSLSAAATAVIGIASFLGPGMGSSIRATAIADQDPAHFAAVLLPAVVFGLFEAINGSRRMLGGVIAAVTTLGVVVSGTRGAWLAVLVAVLLFILPQLRPWRRVAAILTSIMVVVALYQVPGVGNLLGERIGSAVSTGGAGRTDIWSVAATIYETAPVLGVGFANFPVAYTADVVRNTNISSYLHVGAAPHNVMVGTLIELGPIGLLLIAVFLGPLLIRRGWGPDAAAVQAMLASLMTMALFLDLVYNRKQVWLVVGIAAGLAYLARRMRVGTQPYVVATAATESPTSSPQDPL